MPLQEGELVVEGGFRKLETLEDGVVGVAERGRAVAALAAEMYLVVLDATQLLQGTQSLWGSLKVGRLHGRRFKTRRDAMDEIIDWLTFYNPGTRHPCRTRDPPCRVAVVGTGRQ